MVYGEWYKIPGNNEGQSDEIFNSETGDMGVDSEKAACAGFSTSHSSSSETACSESDTGTESLFSGVRSENIARFPSKGKSCSLVACKSKVT